jgi:hypothetical protein
MEKARFCLYRVLINFVPYQYTLLTIFLISKIVPFYIHSLQLGTTIYELSSCVRDSQLSRLFHLRLEDDLVVLLPALGNERLPGEHGAGESDLDVLESAVLLVDGFGGDTEEAQAVEDGDWETTHLGEGWIDVERTVSSLLVFKF